MALVPGPLLPASWRTSAGISARTVPLSGGPVLPPCLMVQHLPFHGRASQFVSEDATDQAQKMRRSMTAVPRKPRLPFVLRKKASGFISTKRRTPSSALFSDLPRRAFGLDYDPVPLFCVHAS